MRNTSKLQKCLICKNEIHNGEPMTAITSGSMYCQDAEGTKDVKVSHMIGAFTFHTDCFKEVAGSEFIPTNFENKQ